MIMSSQTARNAREYFVLVTSGEGGGQNFRMKLYGMLVVSPKGINQKFWSYLGSLHYKAQIVVKVSYRGCTRRKTLKTLLFPFLGSILPVSRKQGLLSWAATRIEPILFNSHSGDFGCGVRELHLYFSTHYSSGGNSAFVVDSAAKTKHSRGKTSRRCARYCKIPTLVTIPWKLY